MKRESDFNYLLKVLHREKTDGPVLFEYHLNDEIYNRLAGYKLPDNPSEKEEFSHRAAAFFAAGYDYITYAPKGFHFTHTQKKEKSISMNDGVQIVDWETFRSYPWPDPGAADYSILKIAETLLPEKMKIVLPAPWGIVENIMSFLGYENLCLLIYDNPDLVKAVCDAIGERLLEYYRICLSYSSIGAIVYNDDWGFNTGPMFAPVFFHTNIFPWVKKMTDLCHREGRPAIIHCCGRVDILMDIIIDDLSFDGKHSFEDKILPIEGAYKKYGSRIALLGGIDLDFICRASKDDIIKRSKNMLALGKTGYALGTGNSVPYYVPMENYFAMISAARLA
jgi:uroporphyrinogen decarboxylase